YSLPEGGSLTLDAGASSDPDGDPLTYSWDVNGDGVNGDAVGVNPTLTWAQLVALGIDDGPAAFAVGVRVDDSHGHIVTSAPTTLTVTNTPPAAGVTGPADGVRGQPRIFTLTAADPSPVDQTEGFTFGIDWGDGTTQTVAGASGVSVNHVYTSSGDYRVQV